MTENYVVAVENLSKSFNGKPAVTNLSLKIKKGEIFGFLGPNGSGKTTTIRMLCGLMTPDTGQGYCMGQPIGADTRLMKQLVGYVPQTFSLYKDLTVRENLIFLARAYEELNYQQDVALLLETLKLKPYEAILAGRLSGGWKQRLSLAAALIHKPQLLLLDEPTAGVDPKARREFWDFIADLSAQGITMLVSTHYMDEAERCHRLAYIMNGRIKAEGSIPDIIQKVGLLTWAAYGSDLPGLANRLRQLPKVEQVTLWGNALRVSSQDNVFLTSLPPTFSAFKWEAVETNLEEVFVFLTEAVD